MVVGDRTGKLVLTAALLLASAGCKSRQQLTNEAAVEQARLMAAQIGTAMKVVTVDAAGSTMLTLVQPPKPGAKIQQISTRALGSSSSPTPDARRPVLPLITPADEPKAPLHPQ